MKRLYQLTALSIVLTITACTHHTQLDAPCPHFGSNCSKAPINSWEQ